MDPASGQLVIRGRSKELIITGGLIVYPQEVEIALESHPRWQRPPWRRVPHPRWGEQVTAWVVLRPGRQLDEDALMAHARTPLAGYKSPNRYSSWPLCPATTLGKVIRHVAQAAQRHG